MQHGLLEALKDSILAVSMRCPDHEVTDKLNQRLFEAVVTTRKEDLLHVAYDALDDVAECQTLELTFLFISDKLLSEIAKLEIELAKEDIDG